MISLTVKDLDGCDEVLSEVTKPINMRVLLKAYDQSQLEVNDYSLKVRNGHRLDRELVEHFLNEQSDPKFPMTLKLVFLVTARDMRPGLSKDAIFIVCLAQSQKER